MNHDTAAAPPTEGHRADAARHHLDDVVLTDAVEHWLRGIARVLSLVVLAGFGIALYEYGPPGASDYVAWQERVSLLALTVAAAGLLLAWFAEGAGGALGIVAGAFVGGLAAIEYPLMVSLAVTLLIVVPSTLFLLAWKRTRTWRAVLVLAIAVAAVLAGGAAFAYQVYDDGHGAAHPQSDREALAASAVDWMWSGGVTTDSATVVATVPDASTVRLGVATDPGLGTVTYTASSRRGPVHRFDLDGLAPDTRYFYAVEADGVLDRVRVGTLRTWPTGPFDFTVALGSCARSGSNGAVFDEILSLEPDLFLSSGDLFYGDVTDNSLDTFSALYGGSLRRPAQAALFAGVPIAYTWDDHDYGPNDSGGDSPSRAAALYSYRELVPHYTFALDGPDAPIAQAFTIGRVRFILTDTRSSRTAPSDGTTPGSMLGAEQLAWFLDELAASAADHAVVVWVSSVPWISERAPGADDWAGYPEERATIAEFVASHGIDNLLMLAGDAHMVAIDDGSNNRYSASGDPSFPVMHAAALDRPGSLKGGPYSEGAYPGPGQFGLLTVHDEGGAQVTVDLVGMDWNGNEIVSLRLTYPAETSP
jgi:phosphodiesterase/alkaline phosphatase D-like protein